MSALRLSPEAVEELAEAAEWYRTQRPGLEMEFLAEVRRVLPLIETSPASFPRLLDLPADLVIRRALLPRFPYAVVFIDLGMEVRVSRGGPWEAATRILAESSGTLIIPVEGQRAPGTGGLRRVTHGGRGGAEQEALRFTDDGRAGPQRSERASQECGGRPCPR